MFMMAEFWVTIAFLVFAGGALYFKVPAMLTNALDQRADRIRKELDEARSLREEAQKILADYRQKQAEAEKEAEAIIAQARREAEAMREETSRSLEVSLERRTRLAEEKIALAQAQAVSEVRAAAVDAALATAEKLLVDKVAGATGKQLVDQGIADLKARFN